MLDVARDFNSDYAKLRSETAAQVTRFLSDQPCTDHPVEIAVLGIAISRAIHGGVHMRLTAAPEPVRLDSPIEVAQLMGLLQGAAGFISAHALSLPDVLRWDGEGE